MRSAFILAGGMLLLAATGAQAQHSGSYTGRRGNTTSWNSSVYNGTATGSVIGPRGNTTTGTASAQYQGHGTYDANGSVTGPKGNSATASGTARYIGGGAYDVTATGPRGATRSGSGVVVPK